MCEVVTKTCRICGETKSINKFVKFGKRCNTCSNRASTIREVTELPDYYILKLICRHKKLDKSKITPEQIIEHRNVLLLKQQARNTKDKRFCHNCQTIKDLSEFSKAGSCKNCKSTKRKIWKQNNKSHIRNYARERLRENKSELTDVYIKNNIRKNLNQNYNLNLKGTDIPQEFVELKRKELILKRKIESYGKEKAPN